MNLQTIILNKRTIFGENSTIIDYPKMRYALIFLFLLFSPTLKADILFFQDNNFDTNPHASLLQAPVSHVYYTRPFDSSDRYLEYSIGGKLPIISYHSDQISVLTGGYGLFYPRFELETVYFKLMSESYLGGAFIDIQYKDFIILANLYHISSHFGDDNLYYNKSEYENCGYEALKGYLDYKLHKLFIISAGYEHKLLRRPENKIFYSDSVFLGFFIDFFTAGYPLFLECETEIFSTSKYPNFGIRTGLYLGSALNSLNGKTAGKGRHELSLHYYNGYSKKGNLYNKREHLLMLGPVYRF
jgi:hypothetical protein